jgi:hypothetical protein
MIIGHSRPSGVTWTVSGSGAAINSPTAQLDDGRPDSVTAFTWRNGTQNTSTQWKLRADWEGVSPAISPGLVGLSNVDLPEGTKVVVAFRRASDTPGTYPYSPTGYVSLQRIVEGPSGERTAWLAFPSGASPVVGCEISIFNDVNGVASIVASAEFTIGEVFIGAADEICPALQPTEDTVDPTVSTFTWNNQPYEIPGTPYRTLAFQLRTASELTWINTYKPLMAKINRGQSCAYALTFRDRDGNFDSIRLHANMLIGIATKTASRRHVARGYWDSGQINVTEAPIPT